MSFPYILVALRHVYKSQWVPNSIFTHLRHFENLAYCVNPEEQVMMEESC